ncbi:MAG TPA: LysM peptidoglycan-binding domain-containing protein [Longimicrobium sp.]
MHRKISTGLVVLSALGAAACTGSRPPAAPAPAPAVVQAPPPPADTLRPIGEGFGLQGTRPEAVGGDLLGTAQYDLPVVANEWVRLEVDFLVNQRKSVVAGWLRQADRYDEWVRDVFASYGIPRDLHHLGMVESGYRATVRSHAGAVGMWQFMPATGRGMGLRIDSLVDERMDPVRATHAAARHLRQLNREFRGDWALAAAAYNAGSGRINRGLGRFNATNFWDLAQRGDLAQETRHYVPRLYAVTIIAKDPARFGYPAPSGPGERFSYDSVRVDLATPLSVLAQAGNLPVQQLVDLNPHMLRQVAPANYFVWVPAGQAAALRQAYAESEFRRRGGFGYYRVREGDSLQRLADLSGVSQDRIRSLNLSTNLDALRPGERLRLFADAARTLNARPVERVARRESRERESGSAEGRSSESRSSEGGGERSANSEREGRSTESRNASASRSSSERGNAAERSTSGDRSERSSSSASSARRTDSGESPSGRSASATSRSEGSSSGNSSRNASGSSRNGESSPRSSSSGASSSRAASATSSSRSGSSSSGAASGRTHKVEDGESLWGIARKYDVTVDAVRAANDMENETIQPGQTLRIPRASSSATASTARPDSARRSASTPTRASEGERRSSSASSGTARTPSAVTGSTERRASASTSGSGERRTGSRADSAASGERRASASASGNASGERGSSSAGSSERRSSTAASGQRANSTTSAARSTESGSRSARRHHTVASGETLWSIARQYNTSVDTLRRANNLAADAQIQPGQRLSIPAAD